METMNVETEPPRFARELIVGFSAVCARAGLDGLLEEVGLAEDTDAAEHPELRTALATRLGNKPEFDARGPRNAKPKQAVECLLAALGVTVADDLVAPIELGGDVRAAITAAFAKVLDGALGVPKVRNDIVGRARTRCSEENWPSFEKVVALLDERGMKLVRQPKIPLHVMQEITASLAAARAVVIGEAIGRAIDEAKPLLAAANAEAAARLDQPISVRATPRDVAIVRACDPQSPPISASTLLADLSELAHLSWTVVEKIARPYSPSITFAVGDAIEHPKFGRGIVVSVAIQRVEVEFAETKLALVHARK